MRVRRLVLSGIFAGILLAASPVSAAECLSVFDPFQVLTLNLQLTSVDWDRIRRDTTFEVEVPARFWADGEDHFNKRRNWVTSRVNSVLSQIAANGPPAPRP
jgi:hypothetical protein